MSSTGDPEAPAAISSWSTSIDQSRSVSPFHCDALGLLVQLVELRPGALLVVPREDGVGVVLRRCGSASSTSVLVIARMASRSSTSSRPRMSASVDMVSSPLVLRMVVVGGRCRLTARPATSRVMSCSHGPGVGSGRSVASNSEEAERQRRGRTPRASRCRWRRSMPPSALADSTISVSRSLALDARRCAQHRRPPRGGAGRRRRPRAAATGLRRARRVVALDEVACRR